MKNRHLGKISRFLPLRFSKRGLQGCVVSRKDLMLKSNWKVNFALYYILSSALQVQDKPKPPLLSINNTNTSKHSQKYVQYSQKYIQYSQKYIQVYTEVCPNINSLKYQSCTKYTVQTTHTHTNILLYP